MSLKSFLFVMLVFMLSSFVGASEFELSSLSIKSSIHSGESVTFPVTLLNTGGDDIFFITYYSEGNFIDEGIRDIFLEGGEEKTFDVVLSSQNLTEGVYTGEINVSSSDKSYILPVIFEVESQSVYFDAITEIAPRFARVPSGDEFEVKIKILNLNLREGDVHLLFEVKDFEGKILFSEEQDLFVKTQAEVKKSFVIPNNAGKGEYIAYALVSDKATGFIGTSSSEFLITDKAFYELYGSSITLFAIIILFVLMVSFVIVNYYWKRRLIISSKNWRKKIGNIKDVDYQGINKRINKLEYQKSLLKEAFDKGYIKSQTYRSDLKDINALIKKLKKRL